jgi:hypothetical protein
MGLIDDHGGIVEVPKSRSKVVYNMEDEWNKCIDDQKRLLKGDTVYSKKKGKGGKQNIVRSWFRDVNNVYYFVPMISNIQVFKGGLKLKTGSDHEKILNSFEKEWKEGKYKSQVDVWDKERLERNKKLVGSK